MQAIVVRQFGGPEVMKLEQVPDPVLGAGQVLVRIRAIGVNPYEAYMRTGTYAIKPSLPYIPGADAAGEIEKVGADVTAFRPGDRVYIWRTASGPTGAYAEKAVCDVSQVHPLPARVSFAQGAAMGVPYATAYHALFHRGGARPADWVLVHGATGGVGTATVQLAHAQGMRVIGTGGTDRGLDMVREQGADFVFNHHAAGYTDEILRATGGRGVDVIVEMAAHLNLDTDLPLLARGGRVVIVGSRGRVEIDPRQTMGRQADLRGMTLFGATDRELESIHAALVAGLANGTLNPVIGREMPLADAAKAHEAIMQPGAIGKIVLVP